jgi:hypothetical protein
MIDAESDGTSHLLQDKSLDLKNTVFEKKLSMDVSFVLVILIYLFKYKI